jgi:hypothetical protein
MEPPKIDELPMLDIEKAMKVAQDYVAELEELKCEGLTEKQTTALAKFTQEIISGIESEE